jgi:hypothetical protein
LLGQAFAHCRKFLAAASRRSLGRVSVPVWLVVLTDQLPVSGLVGRYPANNLMGRRFLRPRITAFPPCRGVCGISTPFGELSPTNGQIPTCSSAVRHSECKHSACDLHALGTPPAFVLSQDQTLHCVEWRASVSRRHPQGSSTVTCVHHHDSVVKVQLPQSQSYSATLSEQKTRGTTQLTRRTPGDVSGLPASAVRGRES